MSYTVDGEILTNRCYIPIDSSFIDGALTDFTVSFDLSTLTTADFWDIVKSDGGDIMVTQSDSTTRVGVDLENFVVGTETGEIYFLLGSIASGADTNFYIYWGNAALSQPAEDAAYGKESAYGSRIAVAHHFSQDPSGSAPQLIDSTANDNDGTAQTAMASGDLEDAKTFGKCIDLNGSDEFFALGTTGMSNTAGTMFMVFEVGFNYETHPSSDVPFWCGVPTTSAVGGIVMDAGINGALFFGGGNSAPTKGNDVYDTGDVMSYGITWDTAPAINKRLYRDGAAGGTNNAYSAQTLSNHFMGGANTGTNEALIKMIDYIVSDEEEPAEWHNARWENLDNHSNFFKAATYEESPIGGGLVGLGMINVT